MKSNEATFLFIIPHNPALEKGLSPFFPFLKIPSAFYRAAGMPSVLTAEKGLFAHSSADLRGRKPPGEDDKSFEQSAVLDKEEKGIYHSYVKY